MLDPSATSATSAASAITGLFDFSAATGLWALFIASFLSATLLPGSSEVALVAMLHRHPESLWPTIGVATVGNTLGAMVSYGLGRLLPNRVSPASIATIQRWGYWALLFTWLPLVGDALAVAAGWLRMHAGLCLVVFAVGKFLRYAVIAGAWGWFAGTP